MKATRGHAGTTLLKFEEPVSSAEARAGLEEERQYQLVRQQRLESVVEEVTALSNEDDPLFDLIAEVLDGVVVRRSIRDTADRLRAGIKRHHSDKPGPYATA